MIVCAGLTNHVLESSRLCCGTLLCYLTVHVVLCFDEFASVNLARVGLTGDDVTLGFMQNFNRDSDRHDENLQHNNNQVTEAKHHIIHLVVIKNRKSLSFVFGYDQGLNYVNKLTI